MSDVLRGSDDRILHLDPPEFAKRLRLMSSCEVAVFAKMRA
jgi:hypothetical protein